MALSRKSTVEEFTQPKMVLAPFSDGLFILLLLKEKEGMHCVAKERLRAEVDFVKVTSNSD